MTSPFAYAADLLDPPAPRWPQPAQFAADLSRGRWHHAPHLDLLSQAIADTIATGGALIVSMPPRHGKSQLTSRNVPAWYLDRWPHRRVVLASYAATFAATWGRAVRNLVTEHQDALDVRLAADSQSKSDWATTAGGGMLTVGVGGPITGRGADLLLVDDPVKNAAEAYSPTIRESVWDWWTTTARTRLEPGGAMIVVMCMTGDTPVLRPDGTDTPLRDIRPGDRIATYEHGRLTTSTVRNWANQGPDDIFAVRMESGRVVRANARHPFLTVGEDGTEKWQRTDSLRPGTRILAATGSESPAPPTIATDPSRARGSARRTTTRPDGQAATGLPRSTPKPAALHASSTATGSLPRTTTGWPPSSKGSAPSAARSQPKGRPTGAGSSASTTITTPARSAGSSATTATSSSSGTSTRTGSAPPLTTWSVTPDTVVEVVPAGRENVFDLQVERTENFIANGLVSHNTRWHHDDLAGRLLAGMDDEHGDRWVEVNLPAIAGPDDPLGRDEGQALWPVRYDVADLAKIRHAVGPAAWQSLYQGAPTTDEGGIFPRSKWSWYDAPRWTVDQHGACWRLGQGPVWQSWDMAFKGNADSDFVVGQVWTADGADRYLLDQVRGRWTFTETCDQLVKLSGRWPEARLKLVEDKANGTAVIDSLNSQVGGMVPVEPQGSKLARAHAVSPLVHAGNVWLPDPHLAPWVNDLIDEAALFPAGPNDDQVDVLSQGLAYDPWVPDTVELNVRRTISAL